MLNLKGRALNKMSKKLGNAMPGLMSFGVDNDQGYNSLIATLRQINDRRKKAHKYIFIISAKPSSKRQ